MENKVENGKMMALHGQDDVVHITRGDLLSGCGDMVPTMIGLVLKQRCKCIQYQNGLDHAF